MSKSTRDPVAIVGLRGLKAAAPSKGPAAMRALRSAARTIPPGFAGTALAANLGGQGLELAMEQTFKREPTSPPLAALRRRGIRRAAALASTDDRAGMTLDVPLADGEEAVVLLEEDGVFSWHLR